MWQLKEDGDKQISQAKISVGSGSVTVREGKGKKRGRKLRNEMHMSVPLNEGVLPLICECDRLGNRDKERQRIKRGNRMTICGCSQTHLAFFKRKQ